MTTLQQLMKEKDITPYGLTKLMGLDPRSMTGHIKKKITGKSSISMNQLHDMLNVISKKAKSIVCEDDVEFYIERVKIK